MTDEIPVQKSIRCTDCNSSVYLIRESNSTLTVTCDCEKQRSIKVARVLPEGWE